MIRYRHANGLDISLSEPFTMYSATAGEEVKYPRGWLMSATAEEIIALGFEAYEVPAEITIPPEPESVSLTRRQLRFGLLALGFTDRDVKALINQNPDTAAREAALIEFEDAQSFNFDHPLFSQLPAAMGITDEVMRAAWMEAAKL